MKDHYKLSHRQKETNNKGNVSSGGGTVIWSPLLVGYFAEEFYADQANFLLVVVAA
jgi:hypothetical protein